MEIASQHLWRKAPTLSAMVSGKEFPKELEQLIADALSKDPRERPATMLMFAERMREAASKRAPLRGEKRDAATDVQCARDEARQSEEPRGRPPRSSKIPTVNERSPARSATLGGRTPELECTAREVRSGGRGRASHQHKTKILIATVVVLANIVVLGLALLVLK